LVVRSYKGTVSELNPRALVADAAMSVRRLMRSACCKSLIREARKQSC
jgi:hypothetical protein